MEIGTAIRLARKSKRMTLEQLALEAGTDVGNLSRLERGMQGANKVLLEKIFQILGITLSGLPGMESNAEPSTVQVTSPGNGPGRNGELSIPQFNVRAAMGSGQLPADYVEVIRHVTMHRSHLEMLGIIYSSPENLAIMTGWGQSMKGTINHGEPVFVDRGVTTFVGDGIYAFTWDGLVYLKRLQKESKTHFKVISDNRNHDPFSVPATELVIHARALLVWNAQKL